MATATRKPRTDARPNTGLRLVLAIGETVYHVERVPCDPDAAERAFTLRKLDGTVYHVWTLDDPRRAACECGDFVFRRDGRDPAGCKHLKALRHFGLL